MAGVLALCISSDQVPNMSGESGSVTVIVAAAVDATVVVVVVAVVVVVEVLAL